MRLEDLQDMRIEPSWFDLGPSSSADPLEEWSGAAGMLCAAGCEAQTFMLLASFAAPLMSLFRTTDGGAVVSIHGGKKSGKTTALTAAASVWGDDKELTMRSYGKSRFHTISDFGYLPVICEGLMNRDPAATREFLAGFLVGKDGEATWSTILLSATAPALFATVMNNDDPMPGVDLPLKVPPALIDTKAKGRLEHTLISTRGYAGLAYLQYVTGKNVLRWSRMQIASKIAGWNDAGLDTDLLRFPLRVIAAVHVAGMIVSKRDLLDVDPERITDWALKQIKAGK